MSAKKEHFKKILIKWVSVDFVKTLFKLAFSCGKGIILLFLLRKNLLSYLYPKQDNQFAGRVGTPCIHHVSRPTWGETHKFGKISAANSQKVREFVGWTILKLWNRSSPTGLDGQLVSLSPTWPIKEAPKFNARNIVWRVFKGLYVRRSSTFCACWGSGPNLTQNDPIQNTA